MPKRTARISTHALTAIIVLCASCHCRHFSLMMNQRVASGATELRTLTNEDMTPIFCAALCGSDCGMFHLSTTTNECSVFQERDYNLGVELTSDPDWIVGYRKQHTTVTQEEWTLVFRAQKSIGVSVWDTWSNVGKHDDNPVPTDFPFACLRFRGYQSCDRHFRSHVLDNWTNIKEVRFSLVRSDTEAAFILFNGTGTSRDFWFSRNTILASTWSPNILNEPFLFDNGVEGDFVIPDVARRFNLAGPRDGCDFDSFYTMIIDQLQDRCINYGTWQIELNSFPTFFYSTAAGRAFAVNGPWDVADVLAVWVKFT